MPREHRVDFAGARHHVMNRGLRRQPIYWEEDDYRAFTRLVARLPELFGLEVHGYALMPNHFHLMIRTPDANLAKAMAWIEHRWVARVNRRNGWDGPLFRARYRNRVVDSDLYWGHLLAYLHDNPVRAGLVGRADQSAHTSHGAYAGLAPAPPWLTLHELQEWYGSRANYLEYIEGLRTGRVVDPDGFGAIMGWARATGLVVPRQRADTAHLEPAEAARLIREITGVDWTEAPVKRGRDGNPHGAFGAWVMHRLAGLTQTEIARHTGVRAASVADRIRSFEDRHHVDPVLWKWTGALDTATRIRVERVGKRASNS